ncbi:MAG: class II aldolase/adducin family protein, partial [Spirochaetia bacterium]|nr:class II aldolase/adducin family protein [Spirochaetia bacterium]
HATGDIPITEVLTDAQIERDYEEETGRQILDCFKGRDPEAVEMVLVASHAPFTWGKSAAKAVYNSAVLEEIARMALLTLQINPKIESIKKTLLDKHYNRKHGQNAYYGQAK